jgi:hypothetical protein
MGSIDEIIIGGTHVCHTLHWSSLQVIWWKARQESKEKEEWNMEVGKKVEVEVKAEVVGKMVNGSGSGW